MLAHVRRGSFFELHYENLSAWRVFDMCLTQWRVSAMGQRTGLDYGAVVAVASIMGHGDEDTLSRVRAIETGALAGFYGKELSELINDPSN